MLKGALVVKKFVSPQEKAEKAYQEQQAMLVANRRLRVLGVSVHEATLEDYKAEFISMQCEMLLLKEALEYIALDKSKALYWNTALNDYIKTAKKALGK